MSSINKNIYQASPFRSVDRLVDAVTARKRTEMFRRIFEGGTMQLDSIADVLDVGSTKDSDYASSNFFARKLSATSRVTLFSDQPIDAQRDIDFAVDGVLVGDALNMGAEVGTYDLVLSSATIEHVGSIQNQRRMIEGCLRAARKYVVITTPNRWHPLEFHTKLPLLHWLPRPLHRRLLKLIGFRFFAEEQNLNLLGRRDLQTMIDVSNLRDRIKSCRVETVRLFGLVSNLVFILELDA